MRLCAPVTHVSSDDPPFLLAIGDKDIAPQGIPDHQRLHESLKSKGVESTVGPMSQGIAIVYTITWSDAGRMIAGAVRGASRSLRSERAPAAPIADPGIANPHRRGARP